VTSDAVREAAGSKTKTPTDGSGDAPTPYSVSLQFPIPR
jgi:hypothetical protein